MTRTLYYEGFYLNKVDELKEKKMAFEMENAKYIKEISYISYYARPVATPGVGQLGQGNSGIE